MSRYGIVYGLPAETNGILRANPSCFLNIFSFFSPQSDNKGDANEPWRIAERMIAGWRDQRCGSAKES